MIYADILTARCLYKMIDIERREVKEPSQARENDLLQIDVKHFYYTLITR